MQVYLVEYQEGLFGHNEAQTPKVFFKKEDAEKEVKHFEATYIGNEYRGYAGIRIIEAY